MLLWLGEVGGVIDARCCLQTKMFFGRCCICFDGGLLTFVVACKQR